MSFILNPTITGGMSAPVMTACTPGSCAACDVSIFSMRACGSGLRRIFAQSAPGICTSAA